jgi:hypothetical protein
VHATDGYASAVLDIRDGTTKRLIAHATQVMIFAMPK